jgi:N-dimethylarginine dimethylaminohydrolase
MCPPDHFGVHYAINPWMKGQIGKVHGERAREQWAGFFNGLKQVADIELLKPRPNLPDLVFTANAGLEHDNKFVLSRFKHCERQREEPCYRSWFRNHGFEVLELPADINFEGAGDALFQPGNDLLWTAYGFRTDRKAHDLLQQAFPHVEVVSLRLRDPRFYHLDTCFCPLPDNRIMYFPEAFDAVSLAAIQDRIPGADRVVVSEQDALAFACNAVQIDRTLFMNHAGSELQAKLSQWGYDVRIHPVSEFLKAGGANKCLTLLLA